MKIEELEVISIYQKENHCLLLKSKLQNFNYINQI